MASDIGRIAEEIIETDVLVIGGGLAGCPLAAKAAEHGLSVTLVEKSKTDRSGNAAMGINYYIVGANPQEGVTAQQLLEWWTNTYVKWTGGTQGRFTNPNIMYQQWDKGLWAMHELEKLGVPMRWFDGEYRYVLDPLRLGDLKVTLNVLWLNVKPILAKAIKERGVNLLERTMIVDLLTRDNRVVGATAVNTRNGKFVVIKAKATVLATGNFARIYNGDMAQSWKHKFHYHWNPATISGDGYAAAYRAGAELANMDLTGHGMIVDELAMGYGLLIRNDGIPGKCLNWRGEEVPSRYWQSMPKLLELEQKGLTPLYYTIEDVLPDDFQRRMEVYLNDMRLATFKLAEERGFNPKTHRYEVPPPMPYTFSLVTGINVGEEYQTSLKGIYAVGDNAAGLHGAYMAVPSGFLLADNLPSIVNNTVEPAIDDAQVESQKEMALAPLAVKDGTEPMELECAIRYICERYVGILKSEGKLREGLRRLGSLRRVFLPGLMAKNPHYLMRALEVRNLMDLAEVHINACLSRKETRGDYIRLDYPEIDSARDNMITIQRLKEGKPILEIKEVPDLKPEYTKEEA